jgi:hypothetical protein
MAVGQLAALVAQYRAGLEAQMALLRRLDALAAQEREVTRAGAFDRLPPITEERDSLMATLVKVEHGLKPIRLQLADRRALLADILEFQQVAALHREAADLATAILAADQHSLEALKEAEYAHRTASQALEQGESTLAAYRRVVTPALTSPTLIDRVG